MTLSTKKVNITYAVYLLISIPVTLLFLLSGVIAKATNNDSIDYDTVLTINDDYYIKVSDAVYIEDENTIKFKLSTKEMEYAQSTGDPPSLLSVCIDDSDDELDFASHKLDDTSTEYTCQINDEQKEFKRLNVSVHYITPDERQPDTTDEFGTVYKGELVEGEEYIIYITISREDVEKMSAEENKHTVTEKVILETTKATRNNSKDSSDSTNDETTTTKATTHKKKTTTKASDSVTTAESENSSVATSANESTQVTNNDTDTASITRNSTTPTSSSVAANTTASTQSAEPFTTATTQSTTFKTTTTTRTTTKATTRATTQATQKPVVTTTTKATSKLVTTTTTKVTTTVSKQSPMAISMRTNSSTYDVYLKLGQSHKVQAVVSPSTSEQGVSWSSLRPNVATVDSNGNIKAVGKGVTIITVTTKNGGLKASCMVTVS